MIKKCLFCFKSSLEKTERVEYNDFSAIYTHTDILSDKEKIQYKEV